MAWAGAVTGQVGWTYDKSMKLVQETVNGSGVSFGYDADGVMTKAGLMTLGYNSAALLTSTTLGSVTDAWTYDAYGAQATYAAKYGTTALFSDTYTRDALGRITAKSETVQGTTHTLRVHVRHARSPHQGDEGWRDERAVHLRRQRQPTQRDDHHRRRRHLRRAGPPAHVRHARLHLRRGRRARFEDGLLDGSRH